MKVSLIIWITLFLFPVCLYSQGNIRSDKEIDNNYRQYKTTFEEDLNTFETSVPEEKPANSVGISTVPAWLLQPLSASSSTISVIGISDPGIDSAIARSQAIFRALYLGSLMGGSTMSNLVDHFAQDSDNKTSEFSGQYIDYFEFTSQSSCEVSDAIVLQEQFTDYGECIIRIEYPINPYPKPTLTFKTVGMISEFEKDGVYECNGRIEFCGQSTNSQAENYQYISRSVNGLVEVESYYQKNLLPISTAKLKYHQPDSLDPAIQTEGCRTNNGLWNAFLSAIIKVVTLEMRTQPSQLKSASDHYTGNSKTLEREAVTGNLTFRLNQILLHDNNLWAILDNLNISKP